MHRPRAGQGERRDSSAKLALVPPELFSDVIGSAAFYLLLRDVQSDDRLVRNSPTHERRPESSWQNKTRRQVSVSGLNIDIEAACLLRTAASGQRYPACRVLCDVGPGSPTNGTYIGLPRRESNSSSRHHCIAYSCRAPRTSPAHPNGRTRRTQDESPWYGSRRGHKKKKQLVESKHPNADDAPRWKRSQHEGRADALVEESFLLCRLARPGLSQPAANAASHSSFEKSRRRSSQFQLDGPRPTGSPRT